MGWEMKKSKAGYSWLQMMHKTLLSFLWLLCGACGGDDRDLIRGFPAMFGRCLAA